MEYQQHGDVLIFKVSELPKGAVKKKGNVVMEGELTGHAHRLSEEGLIYEKDGKLYFQAKNKVTISHEEHKPQVIEPGVYRIRRVKEYDHFLEESRAVKD